MQLQSLLVVICTIEHIDSTQDLVQRVTTLLVLTYLPSEEGRQQQRRRFFAHPETLDAPPTDVEFW